MSDPPRLLDRAESGLGARLLRSAEKDVPPRAARSRALQAASVAAASTGAASLATASAAEAGTSAAANATNVAAANLVAGAATAGTSATTATAGSAAGTSALKGVLLWLSVGAAGGGLATGIAREVASPATTTAVSTPSSTVATKANARSRRAPVPVEITPGHPPVPHPALDVQPDAVNGVTDGAIHDPPQRRMTNRLSQSATRERSPAAAPEPAPTPARPDFGDELVLVDRARAELAAGNGSAALASAATYQERFPRGQFQSEMLALRIQALAAAGQSGRARDLARNFLARYPSHPLAERVRQASGEQ